MTTRLHVVTGSEGAIGKAISALLKSQGHQVIGVDVVQGADLVVNVRDRDAAADVHRAVRGHDLPLAGLVNNAALQAPAMIGAITVQDFDQTIAVNLRAPLMLAQELAPLLATHGGAIVNIASVHAVATSPGLAAYAASKAGLVGLTRSLALELAPDVRVNAVLPGAIDTPMLEEGLRRSDDAAAAREQLEVATPLRRVGSPNDVAEAVWFLLDSERSGFMTGQSVVVDGGVTARLASE
jgi:NAD(P)-dependent dehydrogenase (short-subunit alcohol dehydrogenase family)